MNDNNEAGILTSRMDVIMLSDTRWIDEVIGFLSDAVIHSEDKFSPCG